MGGHIHIEDPPWDKMLRLAQSGSESKRAQNVETIGNGNRGKGASTRQAAKKR